ncbi:MAG TPA: pyridoxamine 5'-phosphate oxidase [Herpetosiphonaceae bacterium]
MLQSTNYEQTVDVAAPDETSDPTALFREWYAEAEQSEPTDPNAMALATAGSNGIPDVRIVLLKGFDARGFVFYTNSESQKGMQLARSMNAAGALHWKSLGRQVRFHGPVELVSEAEADAYFDSRQRNSQIGAWASQQSRPLDRRETLQHVFEQAAARFGMDNIPRPPHWRGYRIRPLYLEFWIGRPFRLHDRLVFTRSNPDAVWAASRLYP